MSKRLQELESLSSRYESERERMRGKLGESVRLLKVVKEEKEREERERKNREKELERVKEELKRREREIERERREKEEIARAEAEARAKAQELLNKQQESTIVQEKQRDRSLGSGLGLQDFLEPTPAK